MPESEQLQFLFDTLLLFFYNLYSLHNEGKICFLLYIQKVKIKSLTKGLIVFPNAANCPRIFNPECRINVRENRGREHQTVCRRKSRRHADGKGGILPPNCLFPIENTEVKRLEMISVTIKKGYDLKIEGRPSGDSEDLPKPAYAAVLPEKIPFIIPRLSAAKGDKVKIGSLLFEDKRHPEVKFLSPGGGEITDIEFGPRRSVKAIVIRLDESESFETFDSVSESDLEKIGYEELTGLLLRRGVWPFIRELPYRDIALADKMPPAIFVTWGDGEPFQPDPEVYLKGKRDLFEFGLRILSKLTKSVYVVGADRRSALPEELKGLVTHVCKGPYPAGDAGMLLYHTKSSPSENRSWYVCAQDLLTMAQSMKKGLYPVERVMVLAGSAAPERKHVRTRAGVPLEHIVRGPVQNQDIRYVVGGLFRGYTAPKDGYMGFYENSLILVPESGEPQLFGFLSPGLKKPTYSRTFLSALNRSELAMDCGLHGDVRGCINCGTCARVCPVDILPQFAFKCVLADEVEEFLEHGILDCTECGLCTYLCPSKIEICKIIKDAKAKYYKEQGER